MSKEGVRHLRTSMTEHGCQLAVFMITGHRDKRIWIKSHGRALFGVAYVSRVENQAKRSSYLLIINFFENFCGRVRPCTCVVVFL